MGKVGRDFWRGRNEGRPHARMAIPSALLRISRQALPPVFGRHLPPIIHGFALPVRSWDYQHSIINGTRMCACDRCVRARVPVSARARLCLCVCVCGSRCSRMPVCVCVCAPARARACVSQMPCSADHKGHTDCYSILQVPQRTLCLGGPQTRLFP